MGKVLLVLVVVVFIYSYIRFKQHYRMSLLFVSYMEEKSNILNNDVDTLLSLCSAYTDAQLYKKAYDKYIEILSSPSLMCSVSQEKIEKINNNIQFCNAPMFGNTGAKDHSSFRYLHNFFLKRFGKRRYVFIREEDALEFNALLRNQRFN